MLNLSYTTLHPVIPLEEARLLGTGNKRKSYIFWGAFDQSKDFRNTRKKEYIKDASENREAIDPSLLGFNFSKGKNVNSGTKRTQHHPRPMGGETKTSREKNSSAGSIFHPQGGSFFYVKYAGARSL